MKLVLHMFRKDVRHFWPEILLNLLLLTAFAWTAPAFWLSDERAQVSRVVPGLLMVLLPVAWLLLISRVVHDETLVGDRQFWITRPYRWAALLGEKALFLLAFLHLPFLLMQEFLLRRASFPVGPHGGGLLLNQLALLVIYALPFAAIGVVTATFGGHVLWLLCGVVYLAALAIFGGRLTLHRMALPYVDGVVISVFAATLAVVVLLMYARRRARTANALLLCLPPALLLIFLFAPARLLIGARYPATSQEAALAWDPDPDQEQPGSGEALRTDGAVVLQLPVKTGALPVAERVESRGAQLTVRAASGFQWSSAWQTASMQFSPGEQERVSVFMPAGVYDRLRSAPVDLELRIAAGRYVPQPAQMFVAPLSDRFSGPDASSCGMGWNETVLECRFVLQSPGLTEITAEVQDVPCLTAGVRHSVTKIAAPVFPGLGLNFDPVALQNFIFNPSFLCPGARVSFARERLVRNEEFSLRQSSVRLPLYVTRHEHGPGQE